MLVFQKATRLEGHPGAGLWEVVVTVAGAVSQPYLLALSTVTATATPTLSATASLSPTIVPHRIEVLPQFIPGDIVFAGLQFRPLCRFI